ncbi:hypothetical protein GXP67_34850 [Rhodocytophaga rosea]|uniref:Yip1 domain-containing protein n=1 Tax=Rhodocytophaga rosea TaxID=2704465 RepID=A0A6C0GV85_9BACT|nr:hypothetical protein [Rhodocytophaga rosea]QHT71473.1 hypothetical protein GXP67_34850 [Rhodocytophaga rosea]
MKQILLHNQLNRMFVIQENKSTATLWLVYAITVLVGGFVVIVLAMWVYGHLFNQEPIDQTAWIILAALLLRVFTVVIALASIQKWGQLFPSWAVLGGLAGSASAQLIYPIAELIVKLVLLTGLIESSPTGLGNMSLTGWFNLSAVWVIFGIPGILFMLAAKNYKISRGLSNRWIWIGGLSGIITLFFIGFLIG